MDFSSDCHFVSKLWRSRETDANLHLTDRVSHITHDSYANKNDFANIDQFSYCDPKANHHANIFP
jgi:hypothetical protein